MPPTGKNVRHVRSLFRFFLKHTINCCPIHQTTSVGRDKGMLFNDERENSYGKDHDDEYDVVLMIKRNEPTLTKLAIGPSIHDFGWEIGKNTRLKEIDFLGFDKDSVVCDDIPSKDFLDFLLCFALN